MLIDLGTCATAAWLCAVRAVCAVQLVDRLDQGAFSSAAPGQLTYQGLYRLVSKALYRTHVEGKLKREIIQVRRNAGGCPVCSSPDMACVVVLAGMCSWGLHSWV